MAAEGGNIKIFVRMRPSRRPSGYFSVNSESNQLEFNVPTNVDADLINNSRTSYNFRFNGMFGMQATQEDIFEAVAKDAVDSALDGYNSTIFAYGQTGSGKTFTITGGAERYEDRGIIPRTLSRIFQAFKDRPKVSYQAYISYLEIYNEAGYDLLDPSHETKALEELPRVSLMEDEEGLVHLKNLSMHAASNEEEALNLLFLGDTNRAIAETPMNMASSRSHCIFTVSIEARQEGSSTVRRSKLHLVDLAGSERVHKTNATGQLFREASHINKSLHFLEMVIVALQELSKGKRTHIPYRNSMMTSVLRDSLGGNCKTTMIATINPEAEHTNESISTCRFAQRVALIKNSATVNEEADPTLLIRALKTKLQGMEAEIKFIKGEAGEEEELSEQDQNSITAAVRTWVDNGKGGDGQGKQEGEGKEGEERQDADDLDIGKVTLTRIKFAFKALKTVALEKARLAGAQAAGVAASGDGSASGGSASSPSHRSHATTAAGDDGGASSAALAAAKEELRTLKAQLQMRDNEIAILVNMVKTAKASAASASSSAGAGAGAGSGASTPLSNTTMATTMTAGMMTMMSGTPSTTMSSSSAATPMSFGSNNNSSNSSVLSASMMSTGSSASAATPNNNAGVGAAASAMMRTSISAPQTTSSVAIMLANGTTVPPEVLKDREKAFDAFKQAYPKNETIESNKKVLKEKYDAAKALAERVNRAREETNRLKGDIEKRRVERAMANIVEGKEGEAGDDTDASSAAAALGPDELEEEMKRSMDAQKADYKTSFQSLRDIKTEIEHIQKLLEGNRVKMQADFESWYANSLRRLQASSSPQQQQQQQEGAAAGSAERPNSGSAVPGSSPAMMMTPQPSSSSFGFSPVQMQQMQQMQQLQQQQQQQYLMPGQVSLPTMGVGMGMGMGMGGYSFPLGGPGAAGGMMPTLPASLPSSAGSMGSTSRPASNPPLPPSSSSSSGGFGFGFGPSPVPAGSGVGGGGSSNGSSIPIPLTGNAAADADIIAFYKAKEELLKKRSAGSMTASGASVGGFDSGRPPVSGGR